MILDHIEEIRKKPIAVRRQYVLVTSILFTGVVVVIWVSGALIQSRIERVAMPLNTSSPLPVTSNDGEGVWSKTKTQFSKMFDFAPSMEPDRMNTQYPETSGVGFSNTFLLEMQEYTTTDDNEEGGDFSGEYTAPSASSDPARMDTTTTSQEQGLVDEVLREVGRE